MHPIWKAGAPPYISVIEDFIGPLIPEGLIIPYTGDLPDGWSDFTDANDKWIMGAGDSYAVGAVAGTGNPTVSVAAGGSHLGGSHGGFLDTYLTGGEGVVNPAGSTTGSHYHNVTLTGFDPGGTEVTLMKSDADYRAFPANARVFAVSDLGAALGLTRVSDYDGYLLKAAAAESLEEPVTAPGASSLGGSSASHRHHTVGNYVVETFYSGSKNIIVTPPSHTVSPTVSYNLMRFWLSVWTNAAAAFQGTTGVIGMYEDTSPPAQSGWSLCDGTNGTPDLRNYFIGCHDTGNHGTSAGNNTATATGTTSSGGSHSHVGANVNNRLNESGYHAAGYGAHTHSLSASPSYRPDGYALAFIMLTG